MRKAIHKRRILAGVLALAALLALLLSAFYVAAEADHDCTGEDCPVCALIHLCENLLRSFAAVILMAAVFAAALQLSSAARFACGFRRMTPVSGRVRMNN